MSNSCTRGENTNKTSMVNIKEQKYKTVKSKTTKSASPSSGMERQRQSETAIWALFWWAVHVTPASEWQGAMRKNFKNMKKQNQKIVKFKSRMNLLNSKLQRYLSVLMAGASDATEWMTVAIPPSRHVWRSSCPRWRQGVATTKGIGEIPFSMENCKHRHIW